MVSSSRETDPVTGLRRTDAARPARPTGAAQPPNRPAPVEPAGRVAAIMQTIATRVEAGTLARAQAVRALVTEVISESLDGLDPALRQQTVDDVVTAMGDEPAWQARLDALLNGIGSAP